MVVVLRYEKYVIHNILSLADLTQNRMKGRGHEEERERKIRFGMVIAMMVVVTKKMVIQFIKELYILHFIITCEYIYSSSITVL